LTVPRFDWPYELPAWEPLPQRPPAEPLRAPGRIDVAQPEIIAESQEGDTSAIERELERRRKKPPHDEPPPQPPSDTPQPPWPSDDGTDACAWYLSFRYARSRNGSPFGIYICVECIDHLAETLWRHGIKHGTAQRLAFEFIYGHEQFHYRVDRGVEMLEHVLNVASGVATQLWLQRWVTSRHPMPRVGLDLLEEACANEQALSVITRTRSRTTTAHDKTIAKRVLTAMMRRSGAGYKDFDKVSGTKTGPAHDMLMSWFLLLHPDGTSRAVGPVSGIRRVIPPQVKKGTLKTDPDVPLYLVHCPKRGRSISA
jgi:hypothetical protein